MSNCLEVSGYPPEEVMATLNWFLDRIHAEERTRITASFQQAFETGTESVLTECRLLHRKGRIITVILQSMPSSEPATPPPSPLWREEFQALPVAHLWRAAKQRLGQHRTGGKPTSPTNETQHVRVLDKQETFHMGQRLATV